MREKICIRVYVVNEKVCTNVRDTTHSRTSVCSIHLSTWIQSQSCQCNRIEHCCANGIRNTKQSQKQDDIGSTYSSSTSSELSTVMFYNAVKFSYSSKIFLTCANSTAVDILLFFWMRLCILTEWMYLCCSKRPYIHVRKGATDCNKTYFISYRKMANIFNIFSLSVFLISKEYRNVLYFIMCADPISNGYNRVCVYGQHPTCFQS